MIDETRRLPDAVLFACNLNRVRSPMAEALLKRLLGDRVFVDSCGLRGPADGYDETEIDPLAVAVMAEVGCDVSGHEAKTFEDLEDDSYDLVISLTPEAHHRAAETARGRAVRMEYWPVADPTLCEGSREARLDAYRQVRDALAARIAERFGS
ncbi:low molecular weight phosphatase family protein [Phenylobacterium sp. VNQ135]|uniref:arsenate-mycothiol transferase ArsC n=1 Tax=Phenylobacterium sp. VNQ135 TaxID=3400922 RepID=UPI003C081ED2